MTTSKGMPLAMDGGPQVRTAPWPARRLFTQAEKAAVCALFDRCMAEGREFAYEGEEEQAYCQAFAAFMGGGYADAVNSGTSAVYVALRALELEPFTEVIAPPVTDMGGVMPVALMNCIPVPADCAPGSYNVGPEQVAARITERTSAIIVAHVAGQPVDMDPILELAQDRAIPVVEDCAQAHGARYKGRLVGTMGAVAAFSTMSGKHHATGGQGGVVYTTDEALYWWARRYADRGKPFNLPGAAGNVVCALNLNLDDLAACVGRVQLGKLPGIVRRCREAALAVAAQCADLEAVRVDTGLPDTEGTFWFLPMQLDLDRVAVDLDGFVAALRAEGVPFEGRYVPPFTRYDWHLNRAVFGTSGYPWTAPEYQGDPDAVYPLPNYDAVEASFFRIKIHERLGAAEVADIAAALRKVETAYLRPSA